MGLIHIFAVIIIVFYLTPFEPKAMRISYCGGNEPSKCTVVKATGRPAYRLEATEELAIGTEVALSAMPKIHKRKECIPCP